MGSTVWDPSSSLTPPAVWGAFPFAVSVTQFGVQASGGDWTLLIQAALNSGAPAVYLPPGVIYGISSPLIVPPYVRLYGEYDQTQILALNPMPAYVPWGSAHQGQMVLLNGNGACFGNIILNGADFYAGGVGAWAFDKNNIEGLIGIHHGNSQGILATASTNLGFRKINIQFASDGIEIWQVNKCTGSDVTVDSVSAGGIFGADCKDTVISDSHISNCGDVGLDWEGGNNCWFIGGNVESCNNGELSYFANGTGSGNVPKNTGFIGISCTRTTTYLAGPSQIVTNCNTSAGAIQLSSVTNGQTGIVYEDIIVTTIGMIGLFSNDLGTIPSGISIVGCQIHGNNQLHLINRAYGLIVKDSIFHGLAGAETHENTWGDPDSAIFEDVIYTYDVTKNTNFALRYFTDTTIVNSPILKKAVFKNCGTFALKHDPAVSGVSLRVEDCNFSDLPVTNAGVESTTAGYPLYQNQTLRFLINENLSGAGPYTVSQNVNLLTALKGVLDICSGNLGIVSGNLRNQYPVHYDSGVPAFASPYGSGSGTGISGSTLGFATFSGSTVTITGPDSTVYGLLKLTVDIAG